MSDPLINSWNGWDPLEEVWLGDVYPASWYDHLDTEVRDCFVEITERTKSDLAVIQSKLEEFGVKVQRPSYNHIDDFVSHDGFLLKPSITPRDEFLVLGEKLFYEENHAELAWRNVINHYSSAGEKTTLLTSGIPTIARGQNTVRAGLDFYIDLYRVGHEQETQKNIKLQLFRDLQTHWGHHFSEVRTHAVYNGGHLDSCFATLAPGLLLASKYFRDYDLTFPGWNLINVSKPEFSHHQRRVPGFNGKWWLDGFQGNSSKSFNQHVIDHARTWIGNYTETYFEVNCLSVDTKNVLILGENETVFRELERHGITAHSVPFRTRTFWDGGLHCLTLDIRRKGRKENYFPDRTQSQGSMDVIHPWN